MSPRLMAVSVNTAALHQAAVHFVQPWTGHTCTLLEAIKVLGDNTRDDASFYKATHNLVTLSWLDKAFRVV